VDETQPLVQFPEPSPLTLYLLAVALIAAVVAAAMIEVVRRRRGHRRRIQREWDAVQAIFDERRIDGDDAALLTELIRRNARREPLHAVTTREGFEAMVEAELGEPPGVESRSSEDLGIRLRGLRRELGLDYVPVGHAIRSTRELHEGQWITMSRAQADPPQWLRVMVEDVNESYFYVMLKDAAGVNQADLSAGTAVRCTLWRDEDARYSFATSIAAYGGSTPTWRLRHTAALDRTQTRADFRVRHDQAVVAGVLNAPREADSGDLKARPIVTRISGRVTSLSAGGCALVFKQAIARHVLLRIALEIPGSNSVDTELAIVSTAAISGGRYLVRGRFLGLSEETRDKIARYVLHKQQRRLAAQSAKG
jgi:c-di-GMP-binding flagellar brake protein YcgR